MFKPSSTFSRTALAAGTSLSARSCSYRSSATRNRRPKTSPQSQNRRRQHQPTSRQHQRLRLRGSRVALPSRRARPCIRSRST